MPSLLDLCEKYFGSRDLYEVLKIPNVANQKQGKHFINLLPNLFLLPGEWRNEHLAQSLKILYVFIFIFQFERHITSCHC